jgi:hypothetical protein
VCVHIYAWKVISVAFLCKNCSRCKETCCSYPRTDVQLILTTYWLTVVTDCWLIDWLTDWHTGRPTNQPRGADAFLRNWQYSHLVKNLPAFYGTRGFITVFIRARHRSLSWAAWIQSTPSSLISLRSILKVFSDLRLGLLSDVFWVMSSLQAFETNFCMHFSSCHSTFPTHLI